MAVSITVNTTDEIRNDVDGDGVADAGDTIETTIVIENSGDTDALNVAISDALDGLTIDPDSVTITPIAVDNVFTITGNTPITFTRAQLVGNDLDPDGNAANLVISNVSAGSNGTIQDNGDGTYTFTPTTGLDAGATATFTYTVRDEDGIENVVGYDGQVTLNITDVVWYVDRNYSGVNGASDGSFLRPFTSMTQLNGANGDGSTNDDVDSAGETIFVYDGGAAVQGAITLENSQNLYGDGHAMTVNGISIGNSGANSIITTSSGTVVTLGSGNTIDGITLNGTGTAGGISGTSFGTLTVSNTVIDVAGQAISLATGNVAGSGFTSTDSDGGTNNVSLTTVTGTLNLGGGALSGASGASFNVSGGTVTTDYNGTITQANNAATVSVSNHTGTLVFDGNVTSTNGSGLAFGNADGTYDFNGNVSLSGGDSGVDILTGSSGTFTFDGASNAINNSGNANAAFNIVGSNANVTWNGNITDTNGNAVNIDNHDSGTVTFQNGTISSTGASAGGIDVINSNGGTVNFASQLTLSTQGNTAVNMTGNGGGTVTITNSSNTVTTTTATAVNIVDTIIGGSGVNFVSISTGAATNGVNLSNTGTSANGVGSGAFTVTGTGADATGGTMNGVGTGYNVSGIGALNLTQVDITNASNDGIFGSNVRGLTLNSVEIDAGNDSNFDRGAEFSNLSGTATVTNSTFGNSAGHAFNVYNSSGTLNLTVTGSTFSGSQVVGAGGDDGLLIEANGTSTIIASVTGSTFSNNEGDHFQFATDGGASTSHITFSGNTLSNAPAGNPELLGGGITISPSGDSDVTFAITGNTITGNNQGGAIDVTTLGSTANMLAQGTISGNNVGNAAQDNSGSAQASGISAENNGNGTLTVLIANNNITEVNGAFSIEIFARAGTGSGGTLNATVTGNTITNPTVAAPNAGIRVTGGTSLGTDKGTINVDINSNNVDTALTNDIRITSNGDVNINLKDFGGPTGASTTAGIGTNIETYLEGRNPGGENASYSAGSTDNQAAIGTTGSVAQPGTPSSPLLAVALPDAPLASAPVAVLGDAPATGGNADTGTGGAGTGTPAVPAHPVIVDDGVLSQAELDYFVAAAIDRWILAGATAEQVAAMRAATFNVVDMTGIYLGASNGSTIEIDADGAGIGWYLDATPGDDAEFTGSGSRLTGQGDAANQIDLLTTVMHELGHQIGIGDSYQSGEADTLMYGYVTVGERRLPTATDTADAGDGPVDASAFALGPIGVGTLPAGSAIEIRFESVVNPYGPGIVAPLNNTTTVSGSNFANSTDPHSLVLDTLTLGGTVFVDADGDNVFDAGEGTAGVTVNLYVDANGNDMLDGAEATSIIASITTDASGNYSFANLGAGNYAVAVGAANFGAGAPLNGRASLSATGDPDDNVENDDNGISIGGGAFRSGLITLSFNGEPTLDGTNQADINNSLDFGFATPNVAPTSANLAGDNVAYVEDDGAVRLDVGGNATIADANNLNFAGGTLTVEISTGLFESEDVLGIAATAAVSFTANTVSVNGVQIATYTGGGAGGLDLVFTFDADATPAALTELVRALTYTNSNGVAPNISTRTVTLTLVDGRGTNEGAGADTLTLDTTVTVARQNDAPVVPDLSDIAATEQTAATVAVAVSDPDLDARNGGAGDYAGATFSINRDSGVSAEDTFAINATGASFTIAGNDLQSGGLTFATLSVIAGGLSISFTSSATTATTALVNEVLGRIQYTNLSDAPPLSVLLAFGLSDGAPGGDQGTVVLDNNYDAGTVTVNITAQNDPLVLTVADTTVGGTEDVNIIFNAANGNAITVSDPDLRSVTMTLGVQSGTLTLSGTTNLAVTGNGTANVQIVGLAADINAAVEGLIYRGNLNFDGSDTLAINIAESGDNDSANIAITLADDGVLQGTAGNDNLGGTNGVDFFDLSQGGSDTASGGDGNDGFLMGAAFDASDAIDGGDGTNDQVGLRGNYTGGNALVLGSTTLRNVELIGLLDDGGNDYDITTHNDNVGAGQVLTVFGTNLGEDNSFTFNGSNETDGSFRIYGGLGTDVVTGGAQNDGFWFGPGRFDPTVDRVNGGGGTNDQLALDGDYTITLDGTSIQNIETITLQRGPVGDSNSFNLTLADSLVANDATLTIWGFPLLTALTVNGAAETDGNLRVYGGAVGDTITGGGGDDWLWGGAGGDRLTGGVGADIFAYDVASQSTGINYDTLVGFNAAEDRIDLPFAVTSVAAPVSGNLSLATFNEDLAAAIGAAQMASGQAVLFTATGGDMAGQTFLIVNGLNSSAGYQDGSDYVFHLESPVGTIITPDPFV
ncbi:cadherin-like domain-containing protein [Sphingomonas sp. LT1P40]|uniref:cadherin-like domain-containing protein n=1 Tax=Alteristakelama amylovorans TaxID=3096166 RepID=UPI002FCB96BC